eukprot:1256606-Pyramimonas_sp.AAC.2
MPPGSGIVHQVNLEYLARVVFTDSEVLYPDSVVGTDSHTTMINGLGVTGWGVGGIEAESVMLGQPMSMVLPPVVGFHLSGTLVSPLTTTTSNLKMEHCIFALHCRDDKSGHRGSSEPTLLDRHLRCCTRPCSRLCETTPGRHPTPRSLSVPNTSVYYFLAYTVRGASPVQPVIDGIGRTDDHTYRLSWYITTRIDPRNAEICVVHSTVCVWDCTTGDRGDGDGPGANLRQDAARARRGGQVRRVLWRRMQGTLTNGADVQPLSSSHSTAREFDSPPDYS